MADLNNVSFTGRATKDALFKNISSGLCEFTIAVNGIKPEDTLFLKVNVWGKNASTLVPMVLKGRQVAVSGSLKRGEWTDREGQTHIDFSVNCFSITLLGSKDKESKSEGDDIPF